MNSIKIKELVNGKETYPSWSTNSTYSIYTKELGNQIEVYYYIKGNRKISRIFPNEIILNPRFCYCLGFLKGEGPTSLGKSNYRRVTITNTNPEILNLVFEELENSNLFLKSQIIKHSISLLHHTKTDQEVINYWSKKLTLPKNKFRCYDDKSKTSDFGVCHIYISDVLLRRVIDLIHDFFQKLQNVFYIFEVLKSSILVTFNNYLTNFNS
jgi:hypothetical protein